MKIYAEQLWALNNSQTFTRRNLKNRLVKSGYHEVLPISYLQAFGARNTGSGRWRYLPTPPLTVAWNYLISQGHTQWRNESGIDSLTTRQMRDRWSRHSSIIPANHMDNHESGASWCGLEGNYIVLMWGGIWNKRKLKGWSLQSIWTCFLKHKWERREFEALNIGVPSWFCQHQP